MKTKEDIIGYDFQGWPIYKMTLREILEELGFQKMENEGNVYWRIADNNPILNLYPRTLEDDGMGMGCNEQFIVEASNVNDEFLNIFVDKDNRVQATSKNM